MRILVILALVLAVGYYVPLELAGICGGIVCAVVLLWPRS